MLVIRTLRWTSTPVWRVLRRGVGMIVVMAVCIFVGVSACILVGVAVIILVGVAACILVGVAILLSLARLPVADGAGNCDRVVAVSRLVVTGGK
jgi:hypothetical protein